MASKFDTIRNKLTITVSGEHHAGKSTLLLQLLRFLRSKNAGIVVDMEDHLVKELEAAEESMDVKFSQHEPIDYSGYDIHFKEEVDKGGRAVKAFAPAPTPIVTEQLASPEMAAFKLQLPVPRPTENVEGMIEDMPGARWVPGNYAYPSPLELVKNTAIIAIDRDEIDSAPVKYILCYYGPDERIAECVNINFQKGPVKNGVPNGMRVEDLLAICADRLTEFQKSKFACGENAIALANVNKALVSLFGRTENRVHREVHNTHEV